MAAIVWVVTIQLVTLAFLSKPRLRRMAVDSAMKIVWWRLFDER
jgi:hypothetical protein